MAMRGGAAELPGSREPPSRAGFVELLFDVVLVFAFTRLTERLLEQLNWSGFYSSMLLTLALWWLWYRMAWTANRYDPARPMIQVMVIVTMLGALLMAAALPAAFRERGVVFAGVFVAIEVFRHLWLVLFGGGGPHVRLVTARIVFWACLSAVPWIAGIFAHHEARVIWWTVAVLIDYAGGLLDFPTPGLGRAGLRGQPIAEEHLTERYRQVLIIAFGESILTSGIHFSPYGFQRDRTAALVVAFVITVLFWQIYYYRAGELLPAAIASSRAPAYVGDLASYAHLIMVIGVAVSAVGDTLAISQPFGDATLSRIAVILGGPALFLLGRSMLDYAGFSRVSWSRPIGLLALGALTPVALLLPLLLVAVTAVAVLAGVATSNVISWRLYPRRMTPPPGLPPEG
ncbi:low temperature requirement protein A [Micromonospora eburnea]|uniref:Low temperature requirement protein LtrA n=1 Tax=Micromonospora eburnea TaxID=227316 RepID=A0A1C6U775_9ACTN|nr:low temperature requirement protein A [Micromonospora eburnea]SCL49844.1 Low temperature requirement protein LtrA [Micromonospora eburnea]